MVVFMRKVQLSGLIWQAKSVFPEWPNGLYVRSSGFAFAKMKVHPEIFMKTKEGRK